MPYEPPPELASLGLNEIAKLVADRKLPPVNEWHPAQTGDSEMRIAADGRWFHQGGEIRRPAMVRAFSSLLRCDDDGSCWLVTPYERLSIIVEDAPFIAVELRNEGAGQQRALAFRLNSDDLVIADSEHALEFHPCPISMSAAGCGRRWRGRFIMNWRNSPWPKITIRWACGVTVPTSLLSKPHELA